MQTRYPIRATAKITGISLDTLRAWERRYQAVVPERFGRGRQYGPEQIERLLLLRRLVQKGHAIGGIAALADQELKDLLTAQPSQETPGPEPPRDMLAPVLRAIDSFDSVRAADELSRLAAVLAPRDLIYQVAVPLMLEVGTRWHSGAFSIAQEHLVSQMLRNLLGGMLHLFRPSRPAMKMVFATPAGESHEFGILAAAMLASLAGIEPVYLGPNLPALAIADAAWRVSARVILLGITLATEITADDVRGVAEAMPENVELWIGGASSGDLDLSKLARPTILIKDLGALEHQCSRWRN
jgi:MerR family transcriptional regulator, light-induced transcriptional regulator